MMDNPAGAPAPGPDLERLREAGSEELLDLVREHLAELEPPLVRQVLHNSFCTPEILEILGEHARLIAFYEVRRDLALHPRTPEPLALRFVPGL